MADRFQIEILEEARDFLLVLREPVRDKILYNIDKATKLNDPELLKKITSDIWEFRTKYQNLQYRLFAFWDKRNNKNVLVVCTHGIIKKSDKVPKKEIVKARAIMKLYFEQY